MVDDHYMRSKRGVMDLLLLYLPLLREYFWGTEQVVLGAHQICYSRMIFNKVGAERPYGLIFMLVSAHLQNVEFFCSDLEFCLRW